VAVTAYSIANWNGPFHRPDRNDTVCGGLEPLELMVPIASGPRVVVLVSQAQMSRIDAY
jgi:hypothetical protein